MSGTLTALRDLLNRRGFLLLLAGGVALACWLPEWLLWTAALDPRVIVASALFLMAWTLPSRNLMRVVRYPWPSLWAFVVSYGFLPASAWLVGLLLPIDFRIGLLISASVPCTLASSVLWTRRAGGDEATALLVILLTTSSSWLITTLWLTFATGTSVAVDVLAMMLDLVSTLIIPVGLGQMCRGVGILNSIASRHKTVISLVAQLLILVILLKAAAAVGEKYRQDSAELSAVTLLLVAGVCVGVHLAALLGGLWSSGAWRFDRPSQIAVAFASSQKTLPVAMLLYERYFRIEHPLAVIPLAFYHVGQLVVDTFIADYLAAQHPPDQEPTPPMDL